MSDQNTSLPVRTEGDLQEKLQSKIVDFLDPTKGAQVDDDKNLHVEIHGNSPTDTDKVIRTNEDGKVALDGEYALSNTIPSSVGIIGHVRNAAKTLVHQLKRISGIDSTVDAGVTALDVAIRDESGNPFTESNPLPVIISESEGVEINKFKQAIAVAALAIDNHDYQVTALKTLKLSQLYISASGKIKAEVQVETGVATGVYNNVFVAFNSTANTNICIPVKETISVAAGVNVRIAITNLENKAQDVYSTISGHEV
jgi:hypothetical protein